MAGRGKIARGALEALEDVFGKSGDVPVDESKRTFFADKFDKEVYHGQRDTETSTGIVDLGDREMLVEDATGEYGGINAFEGISGKLSGVSPADLGTWVTESKDVANYFAGDSGAVYPLKLKLKNPKIYDTYEDLEEDLFLEGSDNFNFVEKLKKQGHDGIEITNSFTDITESRTDYVIFDGQQLRSVHAKFDPSKSESKNILATVPAGVLATGALGSLVEEE